MANPGNQQSQEAKSRNNPQLAPEELQGTDDTQSEFSVNEARADRAGEEDREEQSEDKPSANESDVAETESEFSVNDKLRGK